MKNDKFRRSSSGRNPRPPRRSANELITSGPRQPAVMPTAVQQAAKPAPKQNGSGMSWGKMIIAFAVVMAALVGGVAWKKLHWAPKVTTYGPYVRDGQVDSLPHAVPDSAKIFSEENIKGGYDNGEGARVILVVKNDPMHSGKDWTDTLSLDPSRGYEDPEPTQRRADVARNIPQLMDRIRGWQHPRIGLRQREIYADVTNGVGKWLVDKVDEAFESFQIDKLIDRGDTVRFCGGRIRSGDQLSGFQCVELAGDETHRIEKEHEVLAMLKAPATKEEMKETSLYTGIANFLSQNSVYGDRKVVILSDAEENMPGYTFSVYKDRDAVADTTRWKETDKKVSSQMEIPKLPNTQVEWLAPPDSPGGRDLTRVALRYAKHMLEQRGAKVIIRY